MKKIKSEDMLCYVLIIVLVGISFLIPTAGKFVLVDEVFDVLLIWMACIYAIVKILRSPKAKSAFQKSARILAIAGCVVIIVWWPKNIVLDVINGTEKVHLSDTSVGRYQGRAGIFSYYLKGTDENGEKLIIEILGKDYTELLHVESVMAEYYRYTNRIVEFW